MKVMMDDGPPCVQAVDDVAAHHEAGHGFMAIALNMPLRSVQLGINPRFDLECDPRLTRRLDCVRVLMGGCAAEEVIFGEAVGGANDDPCIYELLTDADNEDALRREVKRFLAANYPAVQRVALALIDNGRLDGDEVEALVRGPDRLKSFPQPACR